MLNLFCIFWHVKVYVYTFAVYNTIIVKSPLKHLSLKKDTLVVYMYMRAFLSLFWLFVKCSKRQHPMSSCNAGTTVHTDKSGLTPSCEACNTSSIHFDEFGRMIIFWASGFEFREKFGKGHLLQQSRQCHPNFPSCKAVKNLLLASITG
jgi:hypothetical protein